MEKKIVERHAFRLRKTSIEIKFRNYALTPKSIIYYISYIILRKNVSVFGVILVRIASHSD